MPDINLDPTDTNIGNTLYWLTAMDGATVISANATQIMLQSGTLTYTLSGNGFTTTIIGGLEYINSGTVDTIGIIVSGSAQYQVTGVNLAGTVLRDALVADGQGTDQAALETLFLSMNYVANGTAGPDFHTIGAATSVDGQSLQMTGSIDYYLGNGADSVLDAGSGADSIFGGGASDVLYGNGGADTIDGGADSDTLYGGIGADSLTGGGGVDSLYGGGDDDRISLTSAVNLGGRAEGGAGNDLIETAGWALVYGDGDNDTVRGAGNDTIYGGDGDDSLEGLAGADALALYGDAGNDTLNGTMSSDTLYGGAGNDVIRGFLDYDYLIGGDNDDVLTITDGEASGDAGNDTLNVEAGGIGQAFLYGGDGNDVLNGSGLDDAQNGGADDDTLNGGGGMDNLDGGTENDRLFGGSEDDLLYGGAGNDSLAGGLDADQLFGGSGGLDFAVYNEAAYGALVINLANAALNTGAAAGDTYSDIEGVISGFGDDTITGDTGDNILIGGGGADSISGGSGNDLIVHAGGLATFDGGSGNDTLEVAGVTFSAGAVIDLETGTYSFGGLTRSWAGLENYRNTTGGGTSQEQVLGTGGANLLDFSLLGSGSTITANGRGGNDTIQGSAGSDTLDGGSGADLVEGRGGDDRFVNTGDAATADDTLDGGAGNDTFVLNPDFFAGNLRGGSGARDLMDGSAYASLSMNVDLGAGTYTEFGVLMQATDIEDVQGGSGNDTVVGSTAANMMNGGAGNDSLSGGDGNDTLAGSAQDDTLAGGIGNDILNGGTGNDSIDGGADIDRLTFTAIAGITVNLGLTTAQVTGDGTDTIANVENLTTGSGNDNLAGSGLDNSISSAGGDDTLNGAAGNDVLYAGAGNDALTGGTGNDLIDGGADVDRVFFTGSIGVTVNLGLTGGQVTGYGIDRLLNIENITSGSGNDNLTGSSADNSLSAGDGNDTLNGGTGNDSLSGGNGNDLLTGGAGNDTLDGGADIDRAFYTGTIAVTVNLGTTSGQNTGYGTDRLIGIEHISSGSGNDLLTGSLADNNLSSGDGADTLSGLDGNDTLAGGNGNDLLTGGAGNDRLDGGGDIDRVFYTGTTAVVVNLGLLTAQNTGYGMDTILNVENITSGDGGDLLTGSALGNSLTAGAGSDTLNGAGGTDALFGGTGGDSLDGGAGNDTLYGGDQADTLTGGADRDLIYGGNGTDLIRVSDGLQDTIDGGTDFFTDRLEVTGDLGPGVVIDLDTGQVRQAGILVTTWSGIEEFLIYGGGNFLTVIGGAADNIMLSDGDGTYQFEGLGGFDGLYGGAFNDALFGGTEGDVLAGNAGNDTLDGGTGADELSGGEGSDRLTGGAGTDSFVFAAGLAVGQSDRIVDFNVADDGILLLRTLFSGIAATGTLATTAFASNLTGNAGDADDRIIYETDTGRLFYDADGTGAAMRILFATVSANLALTNADFLVY